ncbi:GPI inositol-deacylase isoform X2 [Pongo pygmaeus]|uniref:GPI inositol-deacylase isoform X2 n=1 Tax=Pongo pygmaeus TaxID=9600 RepID=UPI0030050E13
MPPLSLFFPSRQPLLAPFPPHFPSFPSPSSPAHPAFSLFLFPLRSALPLQHLLLPRLWESPGQRRRGPGARRRTARLASRQAGHQRRRARLGLGSGAGCRTVSGSLSPGLGPRGGGGGRGGGGSGGGGGTMFLHSVNLWNLAFYVFMVFLATLGLWDVFFGFEENKCSMSYMFEYPEYQKIELPKKLAKRYPAYELYLYGEGSYAEEHKILPLTGIPVLFLPGNAGSYKQVRSIGSIALRKAEDIDFKYHFDFFSVNFNEELVALYGGSLQKQTKFVHECIKTILKLYKGQEFAPKSVAIIGHSMGGLVARALLTLKNFKHDLINLLITQATPHVAPVMPLDRFITDFYTTVNNYWILNARHINLTTLSVAGGFRDYQVRSGLTFLPKLSHHTSALSVVSSAVPKTWVSTDHLSIVWCKQLQLTTVRAFFDLIDADTKQITQNSKKKLSVLNHHFIRHPSKHFEENPAIISELTGTSMWVPVKVSKWTYVAYNESEKIYFTFPLENHRKIYTHVYCQSTMLDTNSWIFACINSTSMCLQGVDLSWKAELLPTIKYLTLRLQDYPSLSHLVVYVPSVHGSKFVVDCEFFKKEKRYIQLPVTHLFSFGLSSRKVVLNTNGLYYNLELLNFGQIYQAFKINVVSKCSAVKEEITSIYRLHIPWSYEDSLTIAQAPSSTEISLKLHIAQPENDTHVALLKMYTSSDCRYEVTVKTSFSQILGQVVRFHGGALPAYVVSNILLAYRGQLYSLFSTGCCLEYATMLDKEAKPYKVDPFVIIIKFLLGYKWFKELWDVLLLPELDAVILTSQSMCFPLISLILFLFGTCTAYWSGLLSSASVRLLSSLWLALKRPSELPKDIKMISPDLPFLTIVLIIVSWTTCGALAILLSYLYYVFKVVHLQASLTTFKNSQPVNPKHSRRSEKKSNHHKDSSIHHLRLSANDAEDSLRMHSTVINLLTWIVLLSMPSLIYWLKNLRYYFKLNPDPCKPLAFILIPTMAILGNTYTVSIKSSKLLKTTSQFPLPLAVGVIAFGLESNGAVIVHCSLELFGSCDPPISASQSRICELVYHRKQDTL